MMTKTARLRVLPLAVALCAALGVGACTNDKDLADASGFGAGASSPGSAQDFVVNVGDRVFFENDSSELTSQSVATLEKQAQRMRTISYGKERPVAVCNDISCWSQNRRAVTVLNTSS